MHFLSSILRILFLTLVISLVPGLPLCILHILEEFYFQSYKRCGANERRKLLHLIPFHFISTLVVASARFKRRLKSIRDYLLFDSLIRNILLE
jgi:hypothetical protein